MMRSWQYKKKKKRRSINAANRKENVSHARLQLQLATVTPGIKAQGKTSNI